MACQDCQSVYESMRGLLWGCENVEEGYEHDIVVVRLLVETVRVHIEVLRLL